MRAYLLFVALVGCSSTQNAVDGGGDGGDAACPSGPFDLNGSPGASVGVPADPVTGACPADYCWECGVLDWPEGCNDLLCLKTTPSEAYPDQCSSLCDAGSDAGDDATSD
jgi:hypothetical protein